MSLRTLHSHHLKLLTVYPFDCDGEAAEVEDEVAVAVDANNVALVATEGTREDAEADVVTGETLKGVAEDGDAFGVRLRHTHEGLHDGVLDGGRTAATAVEDEMVLGKILAEKGLEVTDRTLQENETTDRRLQSALHSALPLLIFILIAVGLMDEEGLPTRYGFLINTTFAYLRTCLKRLPTRCHTLTDTALADTQASFKRLPMRHPFLPYRPGCIGKAGVVLLQPSLQLLGSQMVEKEIAPRGRLFGGGDALHCKCRDIPSTFRADTRSAPKTWRPLGMHRHSLLAVERDSELSSVTILFLFYVCYCDPA